MYSQLKINENNWLKTFHRDVRYLKVIVDTAQSSKCNHNMYLTYLYF